MEYKGAANKGGSVGGFKTDSRDALFYIPRFSGNYWCQFDGKPYRI